MTLSIDIAILIVGLLAALWLGLHPEFGCPPRRPYENDEPQDSYSLVPHGYADAIMAGVLSVNEVRRRIGLSGMAPLKDTMGRYLIEFDGNGRPSSRWGAL